MNNHHQHPIHQQPFSNPSSPLLRSRISEPERMRGLHYTANVLSQETESDWTAAFMQACKHIPALGHTATGFLADWFNVFWELYEAKLRDRVTPSINHSFGREDHQRQHSSPLFQQFSDKNQLVRRFMAVIGLGNRDPSTLSDEERRYLMMMVQKYSSQKIAPNSPSNYYAGDAYSGMTAQNQSPNTASSVSTNGGKRLRSESSPIGVSIPGAPLGPIGRAPPSFPPSPIRTNPQASPQFTHSGDPVIMDKLMANMLSSMIGGSIERQQNTDRRSSTAQHEACSTNTGSVELRSKSQPVPQSDSRKRKVKNEVDNLLMITPLSLTPPPPPFHLSSESSANGGAMLELNTIKTLGHHGCRVNALYRDANKFFAGGSDGRLRVFSESLFDIILHSAHRQSITAISSISGNTVLTAGVDKTISVWTVSGSVLNNKQTITTDGVIRSLAAIRRNDKAVLLALDSDMIFSIWDSIAVNCSSSFTLARSIALQPKNTKGSFSVFPHPTNAPLCAVSISDTIFIINIETVTLQECKQNKFQIAGMFWKGSHLFVIGSNSCLMYDERLRLVNTSPHFPDKVYCAASHDHSPIVALGSNQRIFLWNTEADTLYTSMPIHQGIVNCLASCGDTLVSASDNGLILMHSIAHTSHDRESTSIEDDIDAVLNSINS